MMCFKAYVHFQTTRNDCWRVNEAAAALQFARDLRDKEVLKDQSWDLGVHPQATNTTPYAWLLSETPSLTCPRICVQLCVPDTMMQDRVRSVNEDGTPGKLVDRVLVHVRDVVNKDQYQDSSASTEQVKSVKNSSESECRDVKDRL